MHALQEPQVERQGEEWFQQSVALVVLNRRKEMALLDTGCGQLLARQVQGPHMPDCRLLKCVHDDIKDYPVVVVCLQVVGKSFCCGVGIVSSQDCMVLLGRDCLLLPHLLQKEAGPLEAKNKDRSSTSLAGRTQGVGTMAKGRSYLVVCMGGGDLSQWGPGFLIKNNLLYWQESQGGINVVVPLPNGGGWTQILVFVCYAIR